MALKEYWGKRRFKETPEPKGTRKSSKGALRFVIQKHAATQLHYDFRLELDGVLKSWAIPKGPQLDPTVKRLAMMSEDHPLDYANFEGVIPEGNYGAGPVIIWDHGTYRSIEEADDHPTQEKLLKQMLKKGDLKFILKGHKVKGEYALVKLKNERFGKNSWLLIKHKDDNVSNEDLTRQDRSIVSGKRVEEIGQSASATRSVWDEIRPLAKRARMPEFVKPMLATLVDEPFSDKDWLFELKLDGYRAIASVKKNEVKLNSRNYKSLASKYPQITEQLAQIEEDIMLDGEIVALDRYGKSSFQLLQNYAEDSSPALIYYIFDVLWFRGYDLRALPLAARKRLLTAVFSELDNLRYSDHIEADGEKFFKLVQKRGLEGMIAKRANSPYRDGARSRDWLKVKTHLRQETIIGGYTEPRGSRKHIGSLILGVYEDDMLVYVGHSGGGLPDQRRKELLDSLQKIEQPKSPFKTEPKPNAPVHWVKPKMLCEVAFSEWTSGGHMRQPIIMGIREDKDPKSVMREVAVRTKQVKR